MIEKSTSEILEFSLQLKNKFVRISSDFIAVKEELEKDLLKLKSKGAAIELVNYRDHQIDRLVNFYNECEGIMNQYQNMFQILKIQNIIIEAALDDRVMNDEKFQKKFLGLNNL